MTTSDGPDFDPVALAPASSAIKLRTPAQPEHFVERRRLAGLLDATGTGRVVVVQAPAGSGKTTLVAGWAASVPRSVAWLTLDARDRAPLEFVRNLMAALDRLRPGCVRASLRSLRRGSTFDELVDRLVDEVVVAFDGSSGEPATLVLDDVHVVADIDDVMRALRELMRHVPSWLQLVLITRAVPPLALDRLRLGGTVTSLGFEELRFTESEAAALLGHLAPDGEPSWTADTIERAAGWPAGLQLFALARRALLAVDHDAGVADPHSPAVLAATDYLLNEVLRSEPAELVRFLEDVSVVDRVSTSLARCLSGRDDAAAMLQRAVERGLFMSRRAQGWYELHALVRSVLRQQVADDPERAADLHARAATCLEHAGDVDAALEHWASAGRSRDALRLLVSTQLALYDSGRHDVVRRALATVEPAAYAADFTATLEFTWCQVLVDRGRFLDGVARLTRWAERTAVDGVLAARLTLLRSVASSIQGDWGEGGRLARQAMSELGPEWILDAFGPFGFHMVARCVALSERWSDDHPDVRSAELELEQVPARRLAFEAVRALGESLAGQPLDAVQTAAAVRDAVDVTSMTILHDELRLAEVLARRELGDRGELVTELSELADSPVAPMNHIRLLAGAELVSVHLDRGDHEAAGDAMRALTAMVAAEMPGGPARDRVHRAAAELALATGDVDDAERWAPAIADDLWGPVTEARVRLARGDRHGALVALDTAVARCTRHDVIVGLLRGVATADHEEALKHGAAAVEQAAAHGLVQTVVSLGPQVVELVERCAWQAPTAWLDRVRLRAVRSGSNGHGGADPMAGLVDPLTERERDVLRFLPSRLTLQEIANELYISMNTLKFHLKVIYRKLGVGSRAEAVDVARRMASARNDPAVAPSRRRERGWS